MSTSGESNGPSFGRRLLDALPSVASLAAVFVAVTYAITRYSYMRFYGRFGITPDDVGTSAAGSVAESAFGLLVFVVLFAVVPLLVAVFAFLLVYDPATCRSRIPRSRLSRSLADSGPAGVLSILGFLVAAVVSLVLLFFEQHRTGSHSHPWPPDDFHLTLLVAISCIAVRGAWLPRSRRIHVRPGSSVTQVPIQIGRIVWESRWIIVAMAVIGSGMELFSSVSSDAAKAAWCVRGHKEPIRSVRTHRTFPGVGHWAVLAVRADPATLEWLVKKPPGMSERRRVIYLGEANGMTFAYDDSLKTTLRVPSADVLVIIHRYHHRRRCS